MNRVVVATLLLLAVAHVHAEWDVHKPGLVSVAVPATLLDTVPCAPEVTFSATDKGYQPWPETMRGNVTTGNTFVTEFEVYPRNGTANFTEFTISEFGTARLVFSFDGVESPVVVETYVIPGALSIVPSLITIVIAIALRQVILALLGGVILGAFFANRYNPLTAYLRTLDTLILEALSDPDHSSIIYFCLLLGGMIAVLGKGGGAVGMAEVVTKYATTRRRGMISTYCMGILIFFDDYANALITGSTMRPITDQLLVSREKLSFIVDTCAATVSSLAIVSSWIGVEVGYISEQFRTLDIDKEPYFTFLETIPYRFYPILALVFVLMNIVLERDFGPMLAAERRALREGKVISDTATPAADFEDEDIMPKEGKPKRWFNAVIPVVFVILAIFAGLLIAGYYNILDERDLTEAEIAQATAVGDWARVAELDNELKELEVNVKNLFGHSNPFNALIWASMFGCITAIALVVGQNILTLGEAMDAWLSGCKSMMMALLILMHAWALGSVCIQLHTADYIVQAFSGASDGGFLPVTVFLLSAVVSFATGSSWGTMSILFPLVIPLANNLAPNNDPVMLGTISAILSGSVFGDHISPISDTCIMSSMASSCDHTDHVKTQAVYALVIGAVSIIFGSIPVGFGVYPQYVGLLLGILVLFLILVVFGVNPNDEKLSLASRWFQALAIRMNWTRFIHTGCEGQPISISLAGRVRGQSMNDALLGSREHSSEDGSLSDRTGQKKSMIYPEHYTSMALEFKDRVPHVNNEVGYSSL